MDRASDSSHSRVVPGPGASLRPASEKGSFDSGPLLRPEVSRGDPHHTSDCQWDKAFFDFIASDFHPLTTPSPAWPSRDDREAAVCR